MPNYILDIAEVFLYKCNDKLIQASSLLESIVSIPSNCAAIIIKYHLLAKPDQFDGLIR